MNFRMPGKVYRAAMSPLATSHMLIAAGTEDVQVRLCDIASGAFSHTLSGHRGMLKFLCYCNVYQCFVIYRTLTFWHFKGTILFVWSMV